MRGNPVLITYGLARNAKGATSPSPLRTLIHPWPPAPKGRSMLRPYA